MKESGYAVIIAVSLIITISLISIMALTVRSQITVVKDGMDVLQGMEVMYADPQLSITDAQVVSGDSVKQFVSCFGTRYMFQIATSESPEGFYDVFNINDRQSSCYVGDAKKFRCVVRFVGDTKTIRYVQFIEEGLEGKGYSSPVFDEARAQEVLEVARLNSEIAAYQYLLHERGN